MDFFNILILNEAGVAAGLDTFNLTVAVIFVYSAMLGWVRVADPSPLIETDLLVAFAGTVVAAIIYVVQYALYTLLGFPFILIVLLPVLAVIIGNYLHEK